MAKDILSYKGYTVKVLYDAAARRLYGKVEGISADVAFETTQSAQAFAEAVDAYLARCQAAGVAPKRQYRGLFNVRLSPEAHREMAR